MLERPKSVADVVALVGRARSDGLSLYPVSTGRNWGYGDANPVKPGSILVDLSEMRAIRNRDEISRSNPVAVVEPGVTQGGLQEFLAREQPGLMFNVTGSARETSIIGNCLDRGVGYFGPRREDLFGLEIVTGKGEVIHTGFRRLGDHSPLATCHPYGLGPMLDGLFFQGNFGIVTSACFKLRLRPQYQVGVSLALRGAEHLPRFIDTLAELKRLNIMASVTHIGNMARTRSSLMSGISKYLARYMKLDGDALANEARRALAIVAPNEWTSLGSVAGTRRQVQAALGEIRSRMKGLARVMVIDESRLDIAYRLTHAFRFIPWMRANAAALAAIKPLNGLATGVPTNEAVDNLLWQGGCADLPAEQFHESGCGLVYISPALPMDGEFVARVIGEMRLISSRHGHELYVTVNIETDSSLVAIANLLFDKNDPCQVETAMRCADELHAYIRACNLEVYRARVDMMHEIVDSGSEYWKAVRSLKSALDPDNVIAPGRYNILD